MNSTTLLVVTTTLPLVALLGLVLILWLKDRKELTEVREAKTRAEAQAEAVQSATEDTQRKFEMLAAEALKSNSSAFLDLAKRELEKSSTDAAKDFKAETLEVKKLVEPLRA